ncbi:MBL fold metallo-hydrolase [candidate division KSB1 bacterium]
MKALKIMLFSIFLVNTLNSAPVYSQEKPPDIGIMQINSDLYRLFVNDYVHMFAFMGTEGIFLVDAGFSETVDQVREKLIEFGGGNIKYIVYTHSDGDHTTGYGIIDDNTVIISHPDCREKLSDQENYNKEMLPEMTFEGSLTLNINDETIKMISISGGHSTEDVIVHFEKAGVVCLGDMIISESLPFVRVQEGASIYKLTENIRTVLNIFPGETRFFPSHGREYTKEDLREYLNMLNSTIDIVSKEVKAGKSAEELIKEDVLKDWKSWNNKKWEWINTDLWISTIHYELTNKER